MNRISNFKNRFRILKGGKVSLVVSAMLLSSTVFVSSAKAGVSCENANPLTCERTTQKNLDTDGTFTISDTGSISVSDSEYAIAIEDGTTTITIDNYGKIYVNNNDDNELAIGVASLITSNDFDVILNNIGTIEAYKNGELGDSAYSLLLMGDSDNNGRFIVNNTGTLRGNIVTIGKVNNFGTIELAYYNNSFMNNAIETYNVPRKNNQINKSFYS